MPPIQSLQAPYSDSRILESRQPEPVVPRFNALTPPTSSEELTLRLLGVRYTIEPQAEGALKARQNSDQGIYPIQYSYQQSGPAPAVVVGIVLGSVAGFLILIWLLWTVSNSNNTVIRTTGELEEVETVRTRSKGKRARSRREMQSRSGSSPQRVYRSERIIRDFPPERSRSPSVMRDRSRMRETIIVEEARPERRVPGDDMIEVEMEHSSIDVPRRKSRRQSSR